MKAQRQKRLNLYSVKGAWRFDQSIQSKIIALAFSMAPEIERDLISQRTKEALRFKRVHGMKLGRLAAPAKRKLDPYRPEIENLLANGSTQSLSLVATTRPRPIFTKHGLNCPKILYPY
jgi:DNA invertase Pin-like site-specific DNA recombinase